ncbi:MAG: hypothetical protein ABIP55_09695, partial [Tepidisphaeraceae bacterium]
MASYAWESSSSGDGRVTGAREVGRPGCPDEIGWPGAMGGATTVKAGVDVGFEGEIEAGDGAPAGTTVASTAGKTKTA